MKTPHVMRPIGTNCYLCGKAANGPDDHVPPEVLFRGVGGRSYKRPEIITVPSCRDHNEGTSGDDEVLAWVMSDAASVQSSIGLDVYQSLLIPVSKRIHKDRSFADERLQHSGMRILRDTKDYHENGDPKMPTYDAEYIIRAEQSLRNRWAILERSLQKVAAGLFFHATNGKSLGVLATYKLMVVVPEFKQIGPTITPTGRDCDETTFFPKNLPWQQVVSGSPEVFQCEIAHHSESKKFAMKMLFFNSIRVWITTPKSDIGGGVKNFV